MNIFYCYYFLFDNDGDKLWIVFCSEEILRSMRDFLRSFGKNFQEIFVFFFFERKKTKIFCFGENFDEVFENRDFESFLLFEKK